MKPTNIRDEARHYWRLMKDLADARRNDDREQLADIADEFDALCIMTDWPLLKERCTAVLASIQPGVQIA